jgi:superfamily II DNA or RNA helicase
MSKILSGNGYSISKTDTSVEVLSKCRHDLTIEPFIERPEYGMNVQPIKIYHETQQRMYMPRFYGIKEFGEPDVDKITKQNKNIAFCENLKMKPAFKHLDFQVPIADKLLTQLKNHHGGVLSLYCGAGKCLKYDTPILMYSGEIKKVQDIQIGDQLMGDDSTPRNVMSLARGRETMYKVIPTKGDSYTVNESHILSLKISGHKSIRKYIVKGQQMGWIVKLYDHFCGKFIYKTFTVYYYKDLRDAFKHACMFCDTVTNPDVIDISVTDYLKLPHEKADAFRGYKVGVEFEEKEIDIDPYSLGLWLGNADIRTLNTLKNNDLLMNKHLPHNYKTNSREIRLKVLAGLLDSDSGSFYRNGYDFIHKEKKLSEDVVYLCQSLGFAAYIAECGKPWTNPITRSWTTYYHVSISGKGLEDIPVLLKQYKFNPSVKIKDALSTRIKLEKLPEDDYYGFTIDGNHRFLLGDFTVTHNTLGFGLWSVTQLKVRTIVVCHTTDMMGQWKGEIEQWLPTAKIGIIQQDKAEIEGNDIIIASLKTLAQRSFAPDFFASVGLVIWDEIHLMCTTLFSDAFPKLCTLYSLGLSATPHRKDKCEKIFQYFIGPIFHMEKRAGDSTVEVRCVVFKSPVVIKKNFKNELQYTTTLLGVVYAQDRINYIVQEIVDQVKIGRKMLILSEYVDHLKQLKTGLEKHPEFKDIHVAGLYVGEMKNDQRLVSKEADVILGTYKMASVGMNIPTLDTVLLASPRKDPNQLEQSIGRIFRKTTKFTKLIIDVIDDHNIFQGQGRARKKFYQSYDYTIIQETRNHLGELISKKRINGNKKETDKEQDTIQKFFIQPEEDADADAKK